MARPGIARRGVGRSRALPRDPIADTLVGDLSEHIDHLEVLLFEVLDGRPIWDLAARPAPGFTAHMGECAEIAQKLEESSENLSQAPTERGRVAHDAETGPVPAHMLGTSYASSPVHTSSLPSVPGGGSITRRRWQVKKEDITEGRTKNAARDWGFFSQFETPRLDEKRSVTFVSKSSLPGSCRTMQNTTAQPTRAGSKVLPLSGARKGHGDGDSVSVRGDLIA